MRLTERIIRWLSGSPNGLPDAKRLYIQPLWKEARNNVLAALLWIALVIASIKLIDPSQLIRYWSP